MAIDFEGRHTPDKSIGITEIGLAVLAPPVIDRGSLEFLASPCRTLQDIFRQNTIESYSIRLKERPRSEKNRTPYQFGQVQYIEAEEVGNYASQLSRVDSSPV